MRNITVAFACFALLSTASSAIAQQSSPNSDAWVPPIVISSPLSDKNWWGIGNTPIAISPAITPVAGESIAATAQRLADSKLRQFCKILGYKGAVALAYTVSGNRLTSIDYGVCYYRPANPAEAN